MELASARAQLLLKGRQTPKSMANVKSATLARQTHWTLKVRTLQIRRLKHRRDRKLAQPRAALSLCWIICLKVLASTNLTPSKDTTAEKGQEVAVMTDVEIGGMTRTTEQTTVILLIEVLLILSRSIVRLLTILKTPVTLRIAKLIPSQKTLQS